MAKDKQKPATITLDDKKYVIDEMKDDAKAIMAHIQDLNRKIQTTRFNLEQLQFGQAAFIQSLKAALENEVKDEKKE